MINKIYILSTLLILLFAASCSDRNDFKVETPETGGGAKTTLSFTVELEKDGFDTRGVTDTGYGNGNQVNSLLFALYTQDSSAEDSDEEGALKPVYIKDKDGEYKTSIRVNFNPQEVNNVLITDIEIIKGIEYTLMLWAEYYPEQVTEEDKVYFELTNRGIINAVSYDGYTYPNNDDRRDVFCAVYKVVQYEESRELSFILRRPFAQINIGVEPEVLKLRNYINEEGNLLIEESSIEISGAIANRYNLFKNHAEKYTNSSLIRNYGFSTIPSIAPGNGYDVNSPKDYKKLKVEDRDTGKEKDYIWLSMCYILPDGKSGDLSPINIDKFSFTHLKDGEIKTKTISSDLETGYLTDIPTLRNRRTNIILQAKDFGPWQDEDHSKLSNDNELFNDLILNYMRKISANYVDGNEVDKEAINQILNVFKDYILRDDEGYYNIMLSGEFNLDTTPENSTLSILPVHEDFILYGDGETTIYKKANVSGSNLYHNIGQIRNIHVMDYNEQNHLFIDQDGYLWLEDETGELKNTEKKLNPLNSANNVRSYDIYMNGDIKYSNYYH